MFTSVELDDELFDRAFALSPLRTKKAFFEELLRTYLSLHEQAQVRGLRGKLAWHDESDAMSALRGERPAPRGKRADRR